MTSVIDWGDPEQASRPVREYLAALEQTNPVPPPPKRISLTDPASTWTAAAGPAIFAYSTNYLIDLKAGLIVDVEASAVTKMAEVEATKIMIDRVEEKFAIKPRRLVGDTNYGVAAMLGWLVDEKGSFRTFRYGINLNTMMALSAVPISSSMPETIAMFARPVSTSDHLNEAK